MKKLLLGLGTLAMAAAPVVAVVSCGKNKTKSSASNMDTKETPHDLMKTALDIEQARVNALISSSATATSANAIMSFMSDFNAEAQVKYGISLQGAAAGQHFSYKYTATTTHITIMVMIMGNDDLTPSTAAMPIAFTLATEHAMTHTGSMMSSEQTALNNEQVRVNALISSSAIATSTNAEMSTASDFDTDAQVKYGISLQGAAAGQHFSYKYTATTTHITIMVMITDHADLMSTPHAMPIALTLATGQATGHTETGSMMSAEQIALNNEQTRVNTLTSSSATATLANAAMSTASDFNADAQAKYGISLQGAATGQHFSYKYTATTTHITIMVMITDHADLTSTTHAMPITLSPTPNANTMAALSKKTQDILNVEQSRLNILTSDSSHVTATNANIPSGTTFNSAIALTFGITLGTAAPASGISFEYTYSVSSEGILIKAAITGKALTSDPAPMVKAINFALTPTQKIAADQMLFQHSDRPIAAMSHVATSSKAEFDSTSAPAMDMTMGAIPNALLAILPATIMGVSREYTFKSFDKDKGVLTIGVTSKIEGETDVKGAMFTITDFKTTKDLLGEITGTDIVNEIKRVSTAFNFNAKAFSNRANVPNSITITKAGQIFTFGITPLAMVDGSEENMQGEIKFTYTLTTPIVTTYNPIGGLVISGFLTTLSDSQKATKVQMELDQAMSASELAIGMSGSLPHANSMPQKIQDAIKNHVKNDYSGVMAFTATAHPDAGTLTVAVTYTWGSDTATKEYLFTGFQTTFDAYKMSHPLPLKTVVSSLEHSTKATEVSAIMKKQNDAKTKYNVATTNDDVDAAINAMNAANAEMVSVNVELAKELKTKISQTALNVEQTRLNMLVSTASLVAATNADVAPGTVLDSATALTFGITLGNAASTEGVTFGYTYSVSPDGIVIKAVITGETLTSDPVPLVRPVTFALTPAQKITADQMLFQHSGSLITAMSHVARDSKAEFDPTSAPAMGMTMGVIPDALSAILPAHTMGVSREYTFKSFDKARGVLTIGVTSKIEGETDVKGAMFTITDFKTTEDLLGEITGVDIVKEVKRLSTALDLHAKAFSNIGKVTHSISITKAGQVFTFGITPLTMTEDDENDIKGEIPFTYTLTTPTSDRYMLISGLVISGFPTTLSNSEKATKVQMELDQPMSTHELAIGTSGSLPEASSIPQNIKDAIKHHVTNGYSGAITFTAADHSDTGILTVTVTYTWGTKTATKAYSFTGFQTTFDAYKVTNPLPLKTSKTLPTNDASTDPTITTALNSQNTAQAKYNDATIITMVSAAISDMGKANAAMVEANKKQVLLNTAATAAVNANKKAQDILDAEQTRVNGLLSASAAATTFNTSESGVFDQTAQTKYGISGIHGISTRNEFIAYLRSQGQHVDEAATKWQHLTVPITLNIGGVDIVHPIGSWFYVNWNAGDKLTGISNDHSDSEEHLKRFISSAFVVGHEQPFLLKVIIPNNNKFTYTYVATESGLKITVKLVGQDSLMPTISPKSIVLSPTREVNIAIQTALDVEQRRMNALSSSAATATLANAKMPAGTIFDSDAQIKYGIPIGTAASGQAFKYTYASTATGIIITVVIAGNVDLTSTDSPVSTLLSPSPATNTATLGKVALNIEQTRINGLLSASATATTVVGDESGDFDQAAQTKYGISGIHEINTRDEFIAYLRSQGQVVDPEGLQYQHLTVPITLNIDGTDIVHPIGSSFTVNWNAGDKITVLYWTNSEGGNEEASTRFIGHKVTSTDNPVFEHKVIIPNNKFTYTYVATESGLKITVKLVGQDSLMPTISPKSIVLSPTREVNTALQTALDVEQRRMNALSSSAATATLANAKMPAGTIFDSDAQIKYGIPIGTAASGQTFKYTYASTATGIIITVVIIGGLDLTSTDSPVSTLLSPSPATNTATLGRAALNTEQTRVNGLLSASATATTFSVSESGDFDQAAQTKYGISGIHEINTRDEFIAYLRSQGQVVDEASDAWQHLTVPITLNIDGVDTTFPVGALFYVNWSGTDKLTGMSINNGKLSADLRKFITTNNSLTFTRNVIILNNKFAYTYVATKSGLKITVKLVGNDILAPIPLPKSIALNPTREMNAIALTALEAEQGRINALSSSVATATLVNTEMPAGTIFDANAQVKYGIPIGTAATGQTFKYTYASTSTGIIITVTVDGHSNLVSTVIPGTKLLSPSPATNTATIQTNLNAEQERINTLTSSSATATSANAVMPAGTIFDTDAQAKYGISIGDAATDWAFKYTYSSTLTGISITVTVDGQSNLVSAVTPETKLLSPSPATNTATIQTDLNTEQKRVDALISSSATATSANAVMPAGSLFNPDAQMKYGIALGTPTPGQTFAYTYSATATDIVITVKVVGYATLTSTDSPTSTSLSPSPAKNTVIFEKAVLNSEQTRVNGLLSASATATTFSVSESGDFDQTAQTKYGISGIHEINTRDEFIAYLRWQGQVVDEVGTEWQHLTVSITLNIGGVDIVHPIGSWFYVNWNGGDKLTGISNDHSASEVHLKRLISSVSVAGNEQPFLLKVIIPNNNKFTYTYAATKLGLKITVKLVGRDDIASANAPTSIILSPTRVENTIATTALNAEQSRLNMLTSIESLVAATNKNIVSGTTLNPAIALTYGITLGVSALTNGVSFEYTYEVSSKGITIKAMVVGKTIISNPVPLVRPVIFALSPSQKIAADQMLFPHSDGSITAISHVATSSKAEFDPTSAPAMGATMGPIPDDLSALLPTPIMGVSREYTFKSFDKALGILTIGITSKINGETDVKGATFTITGFKTTEDLLGEIKEYDIVNEIKKTVTTFDFNAKAFSNTAKIPNSITITKAGQVFTFGITLTPMTEDNQNDLKGEMPFTYALTTPVGITYTPITKLVIPGFLATLDDSQKARKVQSELDQAMNTDELAIGTPNSLPDVNSIPKNIKDAIKSHVRDGYLAVITFAATADDSVLIVSVTYTWGTETATKTYSFTGFQTRLEAHKVSNPLPPKVQITASTHNAATALSIQKAVDMQVAAQAEYSGATTTTIVDTAISDMKTANIAMDGANEEQVILNNKAAIAIIDAYKASVPLPVKTPVTIPTSGAEPHAKIQTAVNMQEAAQTKYTSATTTAAIDVATSDMKTANAAMVNANKEQAILNSKAAAIVVVNIYKITHILASKIVAIAEIRDNHKEVTIQTALDDQNAAKTKYDNAKTTIMVDAAISDMIKANTAMVEANKKQVTLNQIAKQEIINEYKKSHHLPTKISKVSISVLALTEATLEAALNMQIAAQTKYHDAKTTAFIDSAIHEMESANTAMTEANVKQTDLNKKAPIPTLAQYKAARPLPKEVLPIPPASSGIVAAITGSQAGIRSAKFEYRDAKTITAVDAAIKHMNSANAAMRGANGVQDHYNKLWG